ncbi:hypothetical protein GCM10023166_31500 [Paeniglutamicibacter cryotolerans]
MHELEDSIEMRTVVRTDAQKLWQLVSEPGWFVNDGEIVEHRITMEGDLATVTDPVHGTFRIRVVDIDPGYYVSYRWIGSSLGEGDGTEDPVPVATLIEFRLNDHGDGVELLVRESGITALDLDADAHCRFLLDNREGWEIELRAVHEHLHAD